MNTIVDFVQEKARLIKELAEEIEVIDYPFAFDDPNRGRSNIGFNCPKVWGSLACGERYRFSAIRACSLIIPGIPGMCNSLEAPNIDYGKGNLYPLLQERFNPKTLQKEWDYHALIWDALGVVLAKSTNIEVK